MQKTLLLDYDNTICDFVEIFCTHWNKLYPDNILKTEDISEYNLYNCIIKKGYDISKLEKFWKESNLYQETYFDCKKREDVLYLARWFKENGYYIELNTMCGTEEMVISKTKKLYSDIELLEIADKITITITNNFDLVSKPTFYDVVIDDNPQYIEKYLKEHKNGLAFMPKWIYNKHLIPRKGIIAI